MSKTPPPNTPRSKTWMWLLPLGLITGLALGLWLPRPAANVPTVSGPGLLPPWTAATPAPAETTRLPTAPPSRVDAGQFAAFLRLAEAGLYEELARSGPVTFPAGALLPPDGIEKLEPFRQGGPPPLTTYILLDEEAGGARRKILLTVDPAQGTVGEFLAEALTLIP